jgi:hypothetical protein
MSESAMVKPAPADAFQGQLKQRSKWSTEHWAQLRKELREQFGMS